MTDRSSARGLAALSIAAALVACGAQTASPTSTPLVTAAPSIVASEPLTTGGVEPAPGSDSQVYAPNPEAIVVAIDPGHGGCLDWGVADPSQRGVELAEKTLTLDIARALRDRLEAEGVTVIMIRDGDVALAGDDYPVLGCEGPPWRDVNGDGEAGFDPEGATRTRDELQARLDLANLTQADAFVSIHINAPFDGGETIEIAFSETFYTDETPWGVDVTEPLARAVQDGVVAGLAAVAGYERGDRGITAHNFYLVAPPLYETTPERPDPVKQPTRGALMPAILSEVGSITLRAEHDLLASPAGQAAVAEGIFDGLSGFFGQREAAVRIGLEDMAVGAVPTPVEGDGPPYWAWPAPDGAWRIRITNTGTEPIAAGSRIVGGWELSDEPYLYLPPAQLVEVGDPLPTLASGESVVVEAAVPEPPLTSGRALAWLSLSIGSSTAADLGSPALQLAREAP